MVVHNLVIHYHDYQFMLEWDTDLGFEVLQYQIFSVTSVPPEDQRILVEDGGLLVLDDSNLESISNKLRLLSIQEEEERERSRASEVEKSDEELARRLQAEEEALLVQQFAAMGDGREFAQRIRPYTEQVLMYEDPIRQDAARKTVPIVELEEKALVSLAKLFIKLQPAALERSVAYFIIWMAKVKEGNFEPSKDESDHAFLLQLLFWFKQSFRWVNSPSCDKCGGGTNNIGMGNPEQSEIKFGAYRVELYRCNICSNITRFPRYNDPSKLLETRSGRCGEWANCFTLYCRAFGYEARLILDFTDHVWTECFSRSLGRWMHLDPCDGIYDNPLLYEKGWNKKLNYVIAIANNGVYDVTKRYTRKWHEALARRNLATETVVASVLSSIREECRAGYSPETLRVLVDRDQKEVEEIEREVYLQVDTSVVLPGRQSGAFDWRRARLECSSIDSGSLSCFTCPLRLCIDDHVTNIYTSFALLRSQILVENLSQMDFLRVLEMLQRLLMDLKIKSFKNRTSFLELNGSQISDEVMLSIERLFAAISLKRELGNIDGNIRVSLCGDPVRTSIALPVALDVVKEIMDNMKGDDVFLKEIQFPRANRLSSGTVLASGEELPFGIASSAFDGTFSTKWEEPNGAKGCWLIYKVSDECMYELQSYDLVSANDASERDPMDWIVEGSEDGGSSWTVLDEQKSQIFEKRFQRKTFTVNKKHKSKAFRFKFLAVRDAKATSRFQIGGITLYAKPNNN